MENKTWKDKLEEVRGFNKTETSPAIIDEKLTSDEIEEMLKEEFKELAEGEKTAVESLEEKRDRLKKELAHIEEEIATSAESVEKTIEKLTERNMLGRLAKSLKLNETGKQKMFDYFEQGEL